jgi:8-oxo-dGTP pyrophosphatase MutT (NUDIX family)
MSQLYSYPTLGRVFPWASCFRAGFIVLYHDLTSVDKPRYEILFVYQKKLQVYDAHHGVRVQSFAGMPKGESEPCDNSAFDTALRETREEVGIDILDPALDARVSRTAFSITRRQTSVEELVFYFIAVLEKKPEIVLAEEELDGYKWLDFRHIQQETDLQFSGPTTRLVSALENTSLYRTGTDTWLRVNRPA